MAVLSYREVLPRTLSHKFGEAPTAELKYVCTLDGATGTQEIINTVGIFHGAEHPEFYYLLCMNVAVNETETAPPVPKSVTVSIAGRTVSGGSGNASSVPTRSRHVPGPMGVPASA